MINCLQTNLIHMHGFPSRGTKPQSKEILHKYLV
ncbi:hypothetical protein SLEP1_g12039 [Rubroshorea leprosula]|nr:hypothetical protein SLEP1_g12039 [Rubroshorea leprosula]